MKLEIDNLSVDHLSLDNTENLDIAVSNISKLLFRSGYNGSIIYIVNFLLFVIRLIISFKKKKNKKKNSNVES